MQKDTFTQKDIFKRKDIFKVMRKIHSETMMFIFDSARICLNTMKGLNVVRVSIHTAG